MGIEIDYMKYVDGKPDFTIDTQVSGWDCCGVITEMTMHWYDEKRDSDGEHQQVRIDQTSLEYANQVLPWTLDLYNKWRLENLGLTKPREFRYDHYSQQEVFDRARSFIREACLNGHGASVSF